MREKLIELIKDAVSEWEFYLTMYLKIGEVPDMSCEEFLADRLLEKGVIVKTDDVVKVKHGYWIDKPTGRYCHVGSWCSVCQQKSGIGGTESNRHKAYCPNCGAKMDLKEGASDGEIYRL